MKRGAEQEDLIRSCFLLSRLLGWKGRIGGQGEKKHHVQLLAGFLFFLSTKSLGRRWGESTPNRKQSVLRVKGQHPESVKAVTVGTDQSQCRGHIDQTWTHTSILSDTHARTMQHLFTLTKWSVPSPCPLTQTACNLSSNNRPSCQWGYCQ